MFTERDLSFFSSNKYAFGVNHGKENVLKKKEQMSRKIIFQKVETAYETRRHCSFASLNLKASEVVRKRAKCFFLSYHSRFSPKNHSRPGYLFFNLKQKAQLFRKRLPFTARSEIQDMLGLHTLQKGPS